MKPYARVGVYAPNGELIRYTIHFDRKEARQSFAIDNGVQWAKLWKRGYRVRAVSNRVAQRG